MIIVMKPGHAADQLDRVVARVKELGYSPHVIKGVERTVIGCVGHEDKTPLATIALMEGVDSAFPVMRPYKLVSREFRPDPSIVKVGQVKIGGGHFAVMGGPCSVESEKQILSTAHAIKEAGGHLLRGGAFKPRTSPYAFQGLAEEGLKLLAKAREQTGLMIVTEVVSVGDVDLVARYADMFQIGARNSQNYPLLSAVGKAGKPVLLKRGMSQTIQEWLLAAEYILKEGNYDVVFCERGIRTFETATRFTLDLNAVPVVQTLSHLPIIVDSAHGTGNRKYIAAMSRAAVAAGADGLMVEVHPEPARALSDGDQSLTFPEWQHLMLDLQPILAAMRKAM